jgi:stage V sporulation protein S
MNRFFSKLDLRDIKIDPTGTRFPPDAGEFEVEPDVMPVAEVAPETVDTPEPVVSRTVVSSWEETEIIETESEVIATTHVQATVARFAEPAGEVEEASSGEVLKVSARSRPSAVAGAIAGVVRESGRAEVQAIGAGATNQAVKAVAIARDYLRETGIDAICLPAFIDVTIDNEDRTAIRLVVEPR